MDRLLRLGAGGMPGLGGSAPPSDAPAVDTAEQVYISSLALLKVIDLILCMNINGAPQKVLLQFSGP